MFIKTILRSYGGTFHDFVAIKEADIAERTGMQVKEVIEKLNFLDKNGIITYRPYKDKTQLFFNMQRQHPDRLPLSLKNYETKKQNARKRYDKMIQYASSNNICRSIQLVSYFGEENPQKCEKCDVCLNENKSLEKEHKKLKIFILNELKNNKININELLNKINLEKNISLEIIKTMIDDNIIEENNGEISMV
jgi:ATP-dependent DNA helicase RecQ